MQEKPRNISWERFENLTSRPFGVRIIRHVDVEDSPAIMRQDDENVVKLERQRRDHEEVARGGHVHVVADESPPPLRGIRLPRLHHVLLHRRFRDRVAKQGKLGHDHRCTPGHVLYRHATDQVDERHTDGRPTWLALRLPPPVEAKAVPVPAYDGVRLHEMHGLLPVLQHLRHQDPEHPIAVLDLGTLDGTFQNGELVSQCNVLESEALPVFGEHTDE